MTFKEQIISAFAPENKPFIDYSDKDIILFDNMRDIALTRSLKLKMNTLVICLSGQASVDINGNTLSIEKNQVLLCPVNVILNNVVQTSDFQCKTLCVTQETLQDFLREKISVWNEMMYVHKLRVKALAPEDVAYHAKLCELIKMYKDTDDAAERPYCKEIVQSLLRASVLALCGALKRASKLNWTPRLSMSEALFQRFLNLICNSEIKYKPVDYYASELGVSAKYLSAVCKKTGGKSANRWITEYVMEDIRYYLTTTNKSMKEVSSLLGFSSASFFGKYVKEHFGVTPATLRKTGQ